MLLRLGKRLKLNYLLLIGLCWLPGLAAAQSTDLAAVIKEEVQRVLDFWKTSIENRNQAEAELFSKEAPGKADNAYRSSLLIRTVMPEMNKFREQATIDAINWGLYAQPGPNESVTGEPYSYFLSKHVTLYCSPQSLEKNFAFPSPPGAAATFPLVRCNPGNSVKIQHGDIKISSLLTPDKYDAADPTQRSELSMVLNLIRTMTDPFPSSKLQEWLRDPKTLTKVENQKQYALALYAEAIINVARHSLLSMAFDRTGIQTPIPGEDGQPSFVSTKEILRNEATRRYGNKEWYDAISQGSQESLLREITHMMAYQTYVNMLNADRMERIETLLAIGLSRDINEAVAAYEALNPPQE